MASRLLLRPTLAVGLGLSSVLAADALLRPQRHRLRCDAGSYAPVSSKDWSFQSYGQAAKTPVVARDGGINPRALRQITTGSILGESVLGWGRVRSGGGIGWAGPGWRRLLGRAELGMGR